MIAQLAFYKGKGDLTDKAIRLWTDSKYSHVELIIDGIWYSTSPRDLCVRAKRIVANAEHWDFVDVEIDRLSVEALYTNTKGAKYDWLGIILSQFLPLDIHSRKRWFCSEWCCEALKIKDSNKYSPGSLYRKVVGIHG